MQYSKEFYQALLEISLRLLEAEDKYVRYPEGKHIAGPWFGKVMEFFDNHPGVDPGFNDLYLLNAESVESLVEDCRRKIAAIEKEEEERALDTRYKLKGILYGRISLCISALAFLLSLYIWLRQSGVF